MDILEAINYLEPDDCLIFNETEVVNFIAAKDGGVDVMYNGFHTFIVYDLIQVPPTVQERIKKSSAYRLIQVTKAVENRAKEFAEARSKYQQTNHKGPNDSINLIT